MKLSPRFHRDENGVALILTLSIMAVLLILVVGLLVQVRTERLASRNYGEVLKARQVALSGIDEAIFLIRESTPIINGTNTFVTQPGRIVRRPASSIAGADLIFSYNGGASVYSNLNSGGMIIASNSTYSGSFTNRLILVDWMSVGTNGLSASGSNPIAFRYAFWMDDEGTKININTAERLRNARIMSPQDISLTELPGIALTNAANSYAVATNTGLYSTESWKAVPNIGPSIYSRNKSYITAFTDQVDFAPTGTNKWNLNALSQSVVDDAQLSMGHAGVSNVFGSTFFNKYGTYGSYVNDSNVVKQILANIVDYGKHEAAANTVCTGGQNAYLNSVGSTNNTLIPRYYLGLRRAPFINEISVAVEYFWYDDPTGCCTILGVPKKMGAIIRPFVELVNPYDVAWGNGMQIKLMMDTFQFWLDGPAMGGKQGPFGSAGGWNYEQSKALTTDVPANGYLSVELPPYRWDNICTNDCAAFVSDAYVKVGRVRLLQTPDNDETIRDWASGQDFAALPAVGDATLPGSPGLQSSFFFTTANIHANWDPGNPPPTTAPDSLLNTSQQGIAKNDPRVKTFTDWIPPAAAWYRVGYDVANAVTMNPAAQNTVVNFSPGTGIANVPNDTPEGGAALVDQSSFYTASPIAASNAAYATPLELGYIHTGLQWRTLQLHPAPTTELTAGMIPDWAVLDLFTVNSAPQVPLKGFININAAITNEASIPRRLLPLQALTVAITNATLAISPAQLATNIHDKTWSSSSSWGANRGNAPYRFDLYNSIGELCEIEGIAQATASPTNDVSQTLASFINLASIRSEQFTVWAVGQSLQVTPTGQTNVLAEAKAQAVIQRFQDAGADLTVGTTDDYVHYKLIYFRWLTD